MRMNPKLEIPIPVGLLEEVVELMYELPGDNFTDKTITELESIIHIYWLREVGREIDSLREHYDSASFDVLSGGKGGGVR